MRAYGLAVSIVTLVSSTVWELVMAPDSTAKPGKEDCNVAKLCASRGGGYMLRTVEMA